MLKRYVYYRLNSSDNNSPGGWFLGALLIIFGLIILIFPRLLIAAIAGIFIFVGLAVLIASLGARR